MSDLLIDARGLHTYYGQSHILRGIDFQVGEDDARCDRVSDVRLTGFSLLTFVGFGAELGGDTDAFDLL